MLPGLPQGPQFRDASVLQEALLCPMSSVSPVCLPPGRSTLSRCCNAPSFLFTTQKNTPLGTKLKYEVDSSGIYHINQEIFRMFPKVLLWAGQPGWAVEPVQPDPLWPCPCGLALLCCALCTQWSWPWLAFLLGSAECLLGFLAGSVWHNECQLAIIWVTFGKKVVVNLGCCMACRGHPEGKHLSPTRGRHKSKNSHAEVVCAREIPANTKHSAERAVWCRMTFGSCLVFQFQSARLKHWGLDQE